MLNDNPYGLLLSMFKLKRKNPALAQFRLAKHRADAGLS